MHLKVNKASKKWPIPRKGRKFVVVPTHNKVRGIPILLVLRDLLRIVHNRREAGLILKSGKVSVNGRIVRDDRFSVGLFDIISLDNKKYRVVFQEKGKFALDSGEEGIAKIMGKTLLSGKKIQIHLSNGNNFIAKEDYKIGDSVIIKDKTLKLIHLEESSKVIVISGKLAGMWGVLEKIQDSFATISSNGKSYIIKLNSIMAVP